MGHYQGALFDVRAAASHLDFFHQVVYDEARLFVSVCKCSWEAGGWKSAAADGRIYSLSDAQVVLACRGRPDTRLDCRFKTVTLNFLIEEKRLKSHGKTSTLRPLQHISPFICFTVCTILAEIKVMF